MPNWDQSAWEAAAEQRERETLMDKWCPDWSRMSDIDVIDALLRQLERGPSKQCK